MAYIVIKCLNCQEVTFIRANQKSVTCRKCGIKNRYKKIKTFKKAKTASEYIQEQKLKEFGSDVTFQFLSMQLRKSRMTLTRFFLLYPCY